MNSLESATVNFWIRERFFGNALSCLDKLMQEKALVNDGHLLLLKAFCLCKLGKISDSVRLLNSMEKKHPEVKVATLHALRIALLSETSIDIQSLKETERQIQSNWMNASDDDAFSSAILLIHAENFDQARPFISRLSSATNSAHLTLHGWIDVLAAGNDLLENALGHFDKAISIDNSVEAFMGKAKVFELRQNPNEMKQTLNALINTDSSALIGYVELAKASAMTRDWDEVGELCQKMAVIQSECIATQLLDITLTVLVNGDMANGEQLLNELFELVVDIESTNVQLHFRLARLLVSIMVDTPLLMQFARKFIDRGIALRQTSESFELKSRLLLADGDSRQAMQLALKAVEFDTSGGLGAMFQVVHCYLEVGNLAEAKNQLEFLRGTHPNIAEQSRFHFLKALIAKRENHAESVVFGHLRQCVDQHFSAFHKTHFKLDFIEGLDPSFLVEIALQLFEMAPAVPSSTSSPSLREIERVLSVAYENCPGFSTPSFLLAKAKFLAGETNMAESILRGCIEKNSKNAEAYLLLAQIHVQKQNLDEAAKLLDVGLGFNFRVREHPLYYLAKARLEKRAGRFEQSVELLNAALELRAFKTGGTDLSKEGTGQLRVSESDRIAIYLELVDALQMTNRIDEADTRMRDATSMYAGRAEEQQLVLMNAQVRLQRGNIDGALTTLGQVRSDQANYQAARIKMAQIYLEEKHDKHRFALCYRDILEQNPSPQAYELLGDAYLSIQEPESAIEAYETAMRRSPKDHRLAEKIGDAYVKCHLYNKAITFYEAAMKSGKRTALRIRFAEQLFQMGNHEKCKKVLREVLDEETEPNEISAIRDHVAYWSLLSKLHIFQANWDEAIKDLQNARTLQLKLVARAQREAIDVQDEKRTAANICQQLAELHANKREWAKTVDFYRETIAHNERDTKSMLALASIFMGIGKLNECNQQCQQVLVVEPNNSDATLLMADLMYQRNEGDQAMKHFAQILERTPNHYHALARYTELGWRSGNIELVEKALRNALENNARATVDAGFNFCKGLIEWYTSDPNGALQAFNRARRDLVWGERALYNMIEICLNPDNEIMGAEAMESEHHMDISERDFGVRTAERFFKEFQLKSIPDRPYKLVDLNRRSLIESFILLASPNKLNVQKAMNNFLEMCKTDGTPEGELNLNVGAILGSARGYLIMKQTQKAKFQLKRIITHPWSLEDAEYLQQCWLLLADIYINQGKNDQASNVLRSVLEHNASCSKAFEYMGFICEKEQKFAEGASNYEAAWKVCKRRNPAIGYKLAYNYFKCHRLFECIEVCHLVLKQHPTYPKIKTEILDKARANIRL